MNEKGGRMYGIKGREQWTGMGRDGKGRRWEDEAKTEGRTRNGKIGK